MSDPAAPLPADRLLDFRAQSFAAEGITHLVQVSGSGPAVLVLPEMPGISPEVLRFARWVRAAGFTVWLPSLFGSDGAVPSADEAVAVFRRACASAEFRVLAAGGSSPVTAWLRALARHAHAHCGGPGVGAIGMCFTGNFALSMMLEPVMLAPVLAQPSLPLDAPAAIAIDAAELDSVAARMRREQLCALGLRFEGDRFCTAARFETYRAALGSQFCARVLPAAAARRDGLSPFFAEIVNAPHSVLTAHLIDAEGEPTRAACAEVIAFLRARLGGSDAGAVTQAV